MNITYDQSIFQMCIVECVCFDFPRELELYIAIHMKLAYWWEQFQIGWV